MIDVDPDLAVAVVDPADVVVVDEFGVPLEAGTELLPLPLLPPPLDGADVSEAEFRAAVEADSLRAVIEAEGARVLLEGQ